MTNKPIEVNEAAVVHEPTANDCPRNNSSSGGDNHPTKPMYHHPDDSVEATTPFVALASDSDVQDDGSDMENNSHEEQGEQSTTAHGWSSATPAVNADDHKTTVLQTFVHLVKGYIGPGCLSLPWAMSQLGIIPGVIICFVLAAWSSYNCWIVVDLKRKLMTGRLYPAWSQPLPPPPPPQQQQQRQLTYPDVAGYMYGPRAQTITALSIGTQQLAICTVFFSFCGDNLQAVLNGIVQTHVDASHPGFSHAAVISFCFPIVLALAMIPDLKRLAHASAFGTILLMIGFGILGVLVLQEWGDRPSYVPETGFPYFNTSRVAQYPLAACALLYSYEGICLILPIESAMRQPKHFGWTFCTAMFVAALTFSTVAAVAVFVFGSISDGSLTAFLLEHYDLVGAPQELIWLLWIANAVVSVSVLVTYPLQLFPALEIVQEALDNRRGPRFTAVQTHDDQNSTEQVQDPDSDDRQATPSPSPPPSSQQDQEQSEEAFHEEEDLENDMEDFVDEPTTEAQHPPEEDGTSEEHSASGKYSVWLRFSLVLFTYVIAVVIPNVQAMIALAGALAGSLTALIIPPALALANGGGRAFSRCSLVFGIIFGTVGTMAALMDIVKESSE